MKRGHGAVNRTFLPGIEKPFGFFDAKETACA